MLILLKLALFTRLFSLASNIPTNKNGPPSTNQFLFQGNVVEVVVYEKICAVSLHYFLFMLGATSTVTKNL
jgi:hypothetical protein